MITAERIDTSFTRIILELGDSSDVLSEEQEAAANDWILRARNDESTLGVMFEIGLFQREAIRQNPIHRFALGKSDYSEKLFSLAPLTTVTAAS